MVFRGLLVGLNGQKSGVAQVCTKSGAEWDPAEGTYETTGIREDFSEDF